MGIGRNLRRHWAVILFPTIAIGSIFADWNHTRLWKKEKAAREQAFK